MRVLILSNFFPPYARGGYEQWCAEVALALRDRGHEIEVITSYEPNESSEYNKSYRGLPVHRILNLEAQGEGLWATAYQFFLRRKRLERESQDQVKEVVEQMRPDVAFIWGMWNVPRSIPVLVENLLFGRVAYYLCDYWLALPSGYKQYWLTPSGRRGTKLIKQMAANLALRVLDNEEVPIPRLDNIYCVSESLCEKILETGVVMGKVRVIHGGTNVEEFSTGDTSLIVRDTNQPLTLLYAGRLTPEKGVHTTLDAIEQLKAENLTLTICGDDRSAYAKNLRMLVQSKGLAERVFFMGSIPREEMPNIMAQHKVLLFPSVWEEPFARTVLEGMAAGLVVIGTMTGGTKEILKEDETGLVFPPEDAEKLASQISRLLADNQLMRRLRDSGLQLVRKRYRLEYMVDALETELISLRQHTVA